MPAFLLYPARLLVCNQIPFCIYWSLFLELHFTIFANKKLHSRSKHLQLEKSCTELQQQHVGQPVLMYNENSFHCPPHADLVKLFPHALKPSCHGTVLLIQGLLCTKCVICQRIPIKGENVTA